MSFWYNPMTHTYTPTEETTRIILDSISDGVFTIDHDFRITSFNRAAEEITGFSGEVAIGRFCRDIFQSDMCAGECTLKRTMEESRPLVNSSTHITTAQGLKIPISLSTALLKDASGKILGGVETFRDMSIVEELRQELAGTVRIGNMLSRNLEVKRIFAILKQLGGSDTSVLIEGETGTGKELFARAIHSNSSRKSKKFVAINCGALPDTLLESELFGYKAGAFTGAVREKQGLFASAGSGTILLDEIGDTSPAFQVKILRLLEEKEFQPLGSVNAVPTKARIIAATNKNLEELVAKGIFRQDLYYRINVIHLKLPPLRRRTEDIPLLIDGFIDKMNTIKDCDIEGIAPDALALLMSHDYPGNIRELENIIEHAFVICRRGIIETIHLPQNHLCKHSFHEKQHHGADKPIAPLSPVRAAERQVIMETLQNSGFNRKVTAQKLGMHKSTLYRKMQKLRIQLPSQDGRSSAIDS